MRRFRPAALGAAACLALLAGPGPEAATLPLPELPPPAASAMPDDRGELVALDVDAAGMALLQARGFTLRERRRLPHLGLELVRLRVPPGLSAADGVAILQALLPEARADVDRPYRLQARGAGLARSPAPACAAPPPGGLERFADVTAAR
ncbi:MAG: hypothetical protein U1E14_04495 [Geminicoccaceae bacterium]